VQFVSVAGQAPQSPPHVAQVSFRSLSQTPLPHFGPGWQDPLTHASPMVVGSLSEQAAVWGSLMQQGMNGGYAKGFGKSKVQGLLSLQFRVPPQFPPPSHWSPVVQLLPSLHVVPAIGQVTVHWAVPLQARRAPQVLASLAQSRVVPRQPPAASQTSL
jgi:hypothetical protein